ERLNDGGGRMVLRRLNRREYQNTIRAFFGVDVSIDSVPDDATVDGFDTIATAHSFSSLHLERYLNTADTVLDAFVGRNVRRQEPQVRRYEPESVDRNIRETLKRDQSRLRLPDSGQRARARNEEIRRVDFEILKNELITNYLDHPASKSGILVPFRGLVPFVKTKESAFGRSGLYKVRVRCGVDRPQPVDGVFLEVRRVPRQTMNIDHIDCVEVRGTIAEPQIIEFEAVVDGTVGNWISLARRTPRTEVLDRFQKYAESDSRYLSRTGGEIVQLADDETPSIWVDWIETEGPFPRFEGTIAPSLVSLSRRATDEEARQMIEKFAFEVFRHQRSSKDYLDRVFKIYKMTRENGADVEEATRECLKVVLASPRFLFLYEPSVDGEKRKLTGRELAVRLSYFLWSGPPDKELYRAAESGELSTPDGLAKQLDRMLDSEKSEEFIVHFVTQF
ncbi:MAG: DUF1592 domain-containing protein, partial [Planctomycetaceae bacterium]|nr:DUF1592 domain-containing protein [Planctomycetaceae bacterium]